CATCSDRSCWPRSCPSAPRCSRRRERPSPCTCGQARARRRWPTTSTCCSSACCAPAASASRATSSRAPERGGAHDASRGRATGRRFRDAATRLLNQLGLLARGALGATGGELVGGVDARRVEFDEARLDLTQHLA